MTTPLDRHARRASERGWAVLARLMASLALLFAAETPVTHGLRARILRLLRPCEVMARRLLLLMASALPPVILPSMTAPFPDTTGWAGSGHQRRLRFGFVEPLKTRINAFFEEEADGTDETALADAAGRKAEPLAPPALDRLRGRFLALQAVMEAPAREARRISRWMEKGGRAARMLPICISRPPGGSSRWPDRETTDLIKDLHHFVRALVWPP